MPSKKLVFEHGELKKYREAIIKAMGSGSESKIQEALKNEGNTMIKKLRDHMNYENELIYTLPIGQLDEKTIDELSSIN